ncbi:thiol-disulfide oxidoreductase DCC family protein [Salininema proteolyticum]|uniref:Thiol-disulfide oxidoreductase DCC family protein n=1 Tax=Salininema proteolyticum TaxID=1607685 RepID=A0ABV8U531_9ACTN
MRPVFVFDGDCAFCTRCAEFVRRRVRTEAEVLPWQEADLGELGLSLEDVEGAVQWVDSDIRAAGPDAIAVLLRRAQWYWKPIGALLSLSLVSRLAWPVYRLVARNRHRMPGGTPACAVEQPPA